VVCVDLVLVCGFYNHPWKRKRREEVGERLKNMVAENNHFTRLSGKQRREERIEG